MQLREEVPSDSDAISALIQAAFATAAHSSQTEAYIVLALRRRGRLSISLVAEHAGQLLGHVAVSPVSLDDGSIGWYGLGPIAVLPERQGEGIGSLLMQAAIARLQALGAAGCVLLGEPDYYQRFGFRALPGLRLADVPPAYFLALPLAGEVPQAEVRYDPAFEADAAQ